jgi:hypothetical protein
VAFTESGSSAMTVSLARPDVPIIAYSPNSKTRRRMALYWGVVPREMPAMHDSDQLVDWCTGDLLAAGYGSPGERVVIVFGAPIGGTAARNSIRPRARLTGAHSRAPAHGRLAQQPLAAYAKRRLRRPRAASRWPSRALQRRRTGRSGPGDGDRQREGRAPQRSARSALGRRASYARPCRGSPPSSRLRTLGVRSARGTQ